MDEVIVLSEKMKLSLSNKDNPNIIKLSPQKIMELPQMGERDIMRSLQLMPGISASNESSSGLYVRGGTPDQNLILLDGFTVYHVDHLYGFFSTFNTNAIKDINLYKGGFEAKYGGRISSVCEINGKDGNQKHVAGGGDLSLLSTNIYLEIPYKEKITSIIAFRRSYQGILYDKIFKKFNSGTSEQRPRGPMTQEYETTVTSYFYDLNTKITYRPSEKDVYSISFYNGADNLDNSNSPSMSMPGGMGGFRGFNADVTDKTNFGNIGSSLKWSRKWSSKLYQNSLIAFSRYYSERDRTTQMAIRNETSTSTIKNGTIENNKLNDYSFKTNFELQLTDFLKSDFGLQASHLLVNYDYSQNDTSKIIERNDKGTLISGYLQSQYRFFNNKLSINLGSRLTNYSNTTKKLYLEPRINIVYSLTPELKVSASAGRYYQFVSRVIREDISSGSRDFWILADTSRVPVSMAYHYITGISYENNEYIFSAEAYYKNIEGLTEFNQRIVPAHRQLTYEENFYVGRGYVRGIEFLVQRKIGKINGWISYTLGQARNQFDVYGESFFPSLQDVRHELKIVGLYAYKKWHFSADWIYASGKPYTAPAGTYSLHLLDGTTQSFVAVGYKNSARMPAYHRLDISATYEFPMFDSNADGSLSFSIFNLYNRKNVWYKEFQIVEGVSVENNVSYFGITPNITFSIKF